MLYRKQILLAEDSEQDVELTLTALGQHHLAQDVVVVHDGAEALDYLYRRGAYSASPKGNPLVVILDIKMPRMTGLEVLRKMKSDPELSRVPVVMLTSSREECDLADSYDLGANAYVVKAVDFQKFLTSVKELGLFWATVNEPPPGPRRRELTDESAQD